MSKSKSNTGRTKAEALKFPSVTTVIKEMTPVPDGLKWWKRKLGHKEAKRQTHIASTIGTLVHYRILNTLCDYPLERPNIPMGDMPEGVASKLEIADGMFEDLRSRTKQGLRIDRTKLAECEKFCVDRELGYCGTYDLCATMSYNGGACVPTICDLKTSAQAHETHFLQLGAYAGFLPEFPMQGAIISVQPNAEKNPTLNAKVVILTEDRLRYYNKEFRKLLRQWHDKYETHLIHVPGDCVTMRRSR